jgi:hypothetical protein
MFLGTTRFDSFGIYADVNKFLLEFNGVVGSLFNVCEYYCEAHRYLKEHFVEEHPAPRLSPRPIPLPLSPRWTLHPRPTPRGEKRGNLFKANILDLGGRSVTGYQSKGKECKIFGYSVLDTVKL